MRYTGILATLVAAALTFSGCGGAGGPSAADKASASAKAASASAAASSSAAAASASAEAEQQRQHKQQLHDTCQTGAGSLLGALQQIDSRLDIGLTYSEYGDKVGDAKVAYDQMIAAKLPRQCLLKVGISAEAALNEYIKVNTLWGNCIDDYSCEFSTGTTNQTAQKDWQAATQLIKAANRGLTLLAP